jgi:transposase-like protein
MVATVVRTIFAQPDATQVRAQFNRVIDQLQSQFPATAEFLIDAETELLAFSSFPAEHWTQIWSNNPQERLNKELRREGPTSWVSSRIGLHASDSSERSSPSSTTSGRSPAAT